MDGSLPYLVAGFGLTWIAVAVYAWRLEARLGRARERLRRHAEGSSRVDAPAGPGGGGTTAPPSNAGPEEAK